MKLGNAHKAEVELGQRRLAVLIDADNAQPSVIEGLLAEIARFGIASVKRIYGDWTSVHHAQWKKSLLKHSISPVQQFAYTTGKNATDSSLIIDAMDLMYTRRFDGFCLVSSDSDFTRLAQRLREEGLTVYGFGEKKTPAPFVVACDKFVYTEVLRPEPKGEPSPTTAEPPKATSPKAKSPKPQGDKAQAPAKLEAKAKPEPPEKLAFPQELLRLAIDEATDESGWAQLGNVGMYLTKIRPDFDPRLYGHKKLSDLLRKYPQSYQLEERGVNKVIYVRAGGPSTTSPA